MTATVPAADLADVASRLERDGAAVVEGVLSDAQVADARDRLWAASAESSRRGIPAATEGLDPNDRNVRVYNLVGLDRFFAELLEHPLADAIVSALLGPDYIVSNFTANIARPGSGSMMVHSDQSFVAPQPWSDAWAINIIWCLGDIRGENGATLHVPGSHRFANRDALPGDLKSRLVPFEAPAGSIVAMDGRVWHTSGANITADEDRPLLFAFYTKQFLRPQWNFAASVPREVQQSLSPTMRRRLGLDAWLNVGAGL